MEIYRLGPELQKVDHLTNEEVHIVTLRFGEECVILEQYGITDLVSRTPEEITFCKAETHHQYIEGNLCIPNPGDIRGKRWRVLFFITKDLLVFVDSGEMTESVIRRARANPKDLIQSREKLLYDYFVTILENDAAVLGKTETEIFKMEEAMNKISFQEFREQTQMLRKDLLILREYYACLSDLAEELEDNDNGICEEDNLSYFGIICGRCDRLLQRTSRLLDFLSQVQTTHNEILVEKQNRNMNYLSVISTIFLPLSLITGWFGMNFQNMPELENGYPYVIAGSLVVVIAIIFIFKKKKIL